VYGVFAGKLSWGTTESYVDMILPVSLETMNVAADRRPDRTARDEAITVMVGSPLDSLDGDLGGVG
jgi:hypothetical protein